MAKNQQRAFAEPLQNSSCTASSAEPTFHQQEQEQVQVRFEAQVRALEERIKQLEHLITSLTQK
jgi:TolA-binding protein